MHILYKSLKTCCWDSDAFQIKCILVYKQKLLCLVIVTRSWPVTQGLPLALHELAEGTVSTDPLVATHCSNPKYWDKKVEWGPRHKPGPDQLKERARSYSA